MYVMLLMVAPSVVSAHVVNKENVYDDIQYSEAAEEIVLLSGIGIIGYEHEDPLYRPHDQLTRGELAEWAVGFLSQSERGVEKGKLETSLISSLEGNATYGDVGDAFFKGKLHLNDPDVEMTREEFAIFMAGNLEVEVDGDGETLMEQAGLSPGPTGEISSVESSEVQRHKLEISNKEYVMDVHPRVLNGPADPILWEGKTIEESWLFQTEEGPTLKQVKFGSGSVKEGKSIVVEQDKEGGVQEKAVTGFPVVVPTIVAACIVLIFFYLKYKRKINK